MPDALNSCRNSFGVQSFFFLKMRLKLEMLFEAAFISHFRYAMRSFYQ